MIALALKLLALQIRQSINVIDIVEEIPVVVEAEFAGVQSFQLGAILRGQSIQTAGNAADLGIMDDGIDGGLQITMPHREGVDAAAVELGEKGQIAVHQCGFLPTPQIEVCEAILAAPLSAGLQNGIIFVPVFQGKRLKIDHCDHLLQTVYHKTGYFTIQETADLMVK